MKRFSDFKMSFDVLRGASGLVLLLVLGLGGCASDQERPGEAVSPAEPIVSAGDYERTLEQWTRSDRRYKGLENKFELSATLLSSQVLSTQIAQAAHQYNWSAEDLTKKRESILNEAQSATKVFLSFFTPVDENNNLDKSSSVWNIYLNAGGKRFAPTSVKRVRGNMAELKQKYPYHNPWSKAYELVFPVPTETATQSGASLVITGPVGSTELKFP